jgi:AcrR family transcriptional regulator
LHVVQDLSETEAMIPAATLGRRERKKLETHRALATAARELALARGLEGLTVEDIADAADVSVRTFFNYFSCKEEALVGVEPAVLEELGAQLRERPASEGPLEALRAVLATGVDDVTEAVRRWSLRTELVRRHPSLLPRHLAALAEIEAALVRALAARLGTDPAADPFPAVAVAAAMATLRATAAWWEDADRPGSLDDAVDRAFATLAAGLPAPTRGRRR